MFREVRNKVKGLFKNGFLRNVGVLAGGAAISQLITIAALPFLTRIYSPQDFSVLAVYASLLAIIAAVSCLRFEIAIPIPKKESQAKELLILALLSVLVVTACTILVVSVFSSQINEITQDRLKGYLWLIPLGGLLSGLYAAFQYWSTRERAFPLISKTRMTQAVSGAGGQLILGYAGVTPLGLLLGQVLNVGAGVWGLSKSYIKKNKLLDGELSIESIRRTFFQYENFPKYSTFEALCNSAAIQVPVLLIASYAAGPEVGFVLLATRLLSAPMGLIGGAVAQVYLSEAPDYYERGELRKFTLKTVLALAKVGVVPMLFAGILAPLIVPVIFGGEWARAGIIVAWMAPWFFMQFVSSPVSMSLHITGNQKAALLLQVIGFLFRSGVVFLFGVNFNYYVTEAYALTGFFFYLLYILVILLVIRGR